MGASVGKAASAAVKVGRVAKVTRNAPKTARAGKTACFTCMKGILCVGDDGICCGEDQETVDELLGHIVMDGEELMMEMAAPQEDHRVGLHEAIDLVRFSGTLQTVIDLARAQIETPVGFKRHERQWAKPKKRLKSMVRVLEVGDAMHQDWSILVEGMICHITLAYEYLEEVPCAACILHCHRVTPTLIR